MKPLRGYDDWLVSGPGGPNDPNMSDPPWEEDLPDMCRSCGSFHDPDGEEPWDCCEEPEPESNARVIYNAYEAAYEREKQESAMDEAISRAEDREAYYGWMSNRGSYDP